MTDDLFDQPDDTARLVAAGWELKPWQRRLCWHSPPIWWGTTVVVCVTTAHAIKEQERREAALREVGYYREAAHG